MTSSGDADLFSRRTVLRTLGAAGLGSGLLAVEASAASSRASAADTADAAGGREPLASTPLAFAIYAGRGDDPDAFGVPTAPALSGFDPNGSFFDTSAIEQTPNGQTLHYGFRFLPSAALVGSPKPYVLVHEGDGRYVSRGQRVNFELEEPAPAPFRFLTAGKWRAVATDVVTLTEQGGDVEWAVTRVDFYDRDTNAYVLSTAYALWSPAFSPVSDANLRTPEQELPDVVADELLAVIAGGRP